MRRRLTLSVLACLLTFAEMGAVIFLVQMMMNSYAEQLRHLPTFVNKRPATSFHSPILTDNSLSSRPGYTAK